MVHRAVHPSVATLLLVWTLTACSSSSDIPVGPALGSVHVVSVTSGVDIDLDGYRVGLDAGSTIGLPPNGGVTFRDVAIGIHDIVLSEVATNCTIGTSSTQAVSVIAGQTAEVGFTVTCISRTPALPRYGTVEVTVSTSGAELDPNGYAVLLTDPAGTVNSARLPRTGSVKLNAVVGVQYTVRLDDVATNCRVAEPASGTRTATVDEGQNLGLTFAIECLPTYPAKLPAGSQLAFVRDGRIHLVNSDGSGVVKLTDGPSDCDPAWSPDGLRIAFVRGCGTTPDIYVMNADGSNVVRRTLSGRAADPAWSPDGTHIAFAQVSSGSSNIFVMTATDDGSSQMELSSYAGWEAQPSWSPDGKTIAFASDKVLFDFVSDVFVVDLATRFISQLTNSVSSGNALPQFFEPTWSRDGAIIAMDKCKLETERCPTGWIAVMGRDGSAIRELVQTTGGLAGPTWSPDGLTIAFSSFGDISWVRADGTSRGFIVANGRSPAWRPTPSGSITR